MTREEAWELLCEYNQEEFHLRQGRTVEQVMRYFAREDGMAARKNSGGLWACSTTWITSGTPSSTA